MAKLIYHGREIISFHEDKIHLSVVMCCGNPILFPFAGRTENDTYEVDGKAYSMPFHGLVKEAAFAVKEIGPNKATLWIENSGTNKADHYPYDCRLEITYELLDDEVRLIPRVCNNSDRELVHSFGWHPFFVASEKEAFKLHVNMTEYQDWVTGKVYENPKTVDCTRDIDCVFTGRTKDSLTIRNEADGYEAVLEMDPAYKTVVVCSVFEKRVCVEPWIGPPDAVHKEGCPEYVPAKSFREYPMSIKLQEV